MGIAELLNTIALLLPGYFGTWAMSFIVGIRKREWAQVTLYSLIFSALAYLIVLKLSPYIIGDILNIKHGNDKYGIQAALNEVSNLGTDLGRSKGKIAFHNVVKLIFIVTPVSFLLGSLAGWFRSSQLYKRQVVKFAKRTHNSDIWTDFHERHPIGPHTVILKDGNAYFGQILMASDTLTGSDRGIIMEQPIAIEKYTDSSFRSHEAAKFEMPGDVLIFADQISAISDNRHPGIIAWHRENANSKRLRNRLRNLAALLHGSIRQRNSITLDRGPEE